jgi:hypothetical protein
VFACVFVFCIFCTFGDSFVLFDEFSILDFIFVFVLILVFAFNGFVFNGFEKLSSVIRYHLHRSEMARWRKDVW